MKKSWIVLLMAAAALSACGGGDDDAPAPPPVTEAVPASASASVAGLIAYLKALVVASADTLEPVNVSAVTPQSDDLVEPTAVD